MQEQKEKQGRVRKALTLTANSEEETTEKAEDRTEFVARFLFAMAFNRINPPFPGRQATEAEAEAEAGEERQRRGEQGSWPWRSWALQADDAAAILPLLRRSELCAELVLSS
jgi:hypothetical protein